MSSPISPGSSPFATALRQERSARQLTVSDVAKNLLLSENQVRGLETDDLGSFYNASYAERAARRYAAWLGIDVDLEGAPARKFQGTAQTAPPAPVAWPKAGIARRRSRFAHSVFLRWGLASALIAVTATLLWMTQAQSQVAKPPVIELPNTVPAVELQPAELPAGSGGMMQVVNNAAG